MSLSKSIKFGAHTISNTGPVYVIAEAGVNHNGNVEMGMRMIEVAKEAGADAVKFQTFKAEHLNTRAAPKATYHIETTGNQQGWFDLLKTQELDRKAHEVLIAHCKKVGIAFLSTPYDEESVDLLDDLDVIGYKVASTDANNIPFLKYMARKKRPIILSTGMCNFEEVKQSVAAIRSVGCEDLMVLHCTANYPAPLQDSNLRAMLAMRDELNVIVGYSDHTLGNVNAVASTVLGSKVYERHFTLGKQLPGPDHRASLTAEELKETIQLIRSAEMVLGSSEKKPMPSETENRLKLRKSVVARINITAGSVITAAMITTKRPGTGMEPKLLESLIGRRARQDITADTLLKQELFE